MTGLTNPKASITLCTSVAVHALALDQLLLLPGAYTQMNIHTETCKDAPRQKCFIRPGISSGSGLRPLPLSFLKVLSPQLGGKPLRAGPSPLHRMER